MKNVGLCFWCSKGTSVHASHNTPAIWCKQVAKHAKDSNKLAWQVLLLGSNGTWHFMIAVCNCFCSKSTSYPKFYCLRQATSKRGEISFGNSIAFGKSTSQRIYPKQHTPEIG